MKKLSAALICILLVLALLACPAFAAADIVEPTEQLYVADYANVLSEDTEQHIVSRAQALKEACGGEIAVVTIDFLNDLDSEEYAYELINQWGVGDAEKQNGAVMLLVIGEGKGWITVGSGLEGYISAGKLETLANDYLWDPFDAGEYDTAVVGTFDQLLGFYESYYGVTLAGGSAAETAQPYAEEESGPSGFFTLMAVVIIAVVLIFVSLLTRPFRRRRYGGFWGPRPPRGPRPPHGPFGPGPGPFGPGGGPRGGGCGGSRGGFGGGSFGGGGGRGGGAGRR